MDIDSIEWRQYLLRGAEKMGLELSEEEAATMARHARELMIWNRRTNLTRLTHPKHIAEQHYLDSIAPMGWISDTATILDIGSGGGFPGIPLKIVTPLANVVLVDAVRKKVTFMNHVLRLLHLDNIHARQVRAESMNRQHVDCPPNGFTVIISRALTSLEGFVSMALPLLADDGMIIALKGRGQQVEAELTDLNQQFPPDTLERLPSIRTIRYRLT